MTPELEDRVGLTAALTSSYEAAAQAWVEPLLSQLNMGRKRGCCKRSIIRRPGARPRTGWRDGIVLLAVTRPFQPENRSSTRKLELDWGAHAPRVRFSAPSRKTASVLNRSGSANPCCARKGWTRGASSHTRGGCAPQLRFSGSNGAQFWISPGGWRICWRRMWRAAISTGTLFGLKINTVSGCTPIASPLFPGR